MDRSRLLGAVLSAIVVTSPMVSKSFASVARNAAPTAVEIRQRAVEDRDTWSIERRAYKRIVDDCIRRITAGEENLTCPDINDAAAIRAFVRGDKGPQGASTGSGTPVLTLDDISTGDLSLLRRYRNLQQCPEGLKSGKQAGFYEFCLTFIRDKRPLTERQKIINRQVKLRLRQITGAHASSSKADSLNDRLDSLPQGIRPDR